MKLSIVIPVYNVEKYLRECLDSCLEQDIPASDYEIITINDGSTDGSLAILEEYAPKYENLILVNQKNLSASVARNRGIELARGEYIWFIDSDDKIEKNCLSKVVDGHTEDIVMFGGHYQYNERSAKAMPYAYIPLQEIPRRILQVQPWLYLFKKDFLLRNQLKYAPGIYFEDSLFSPHCFSLTKSIGYIPHIFYYYRFNPLSMTNHMTKKKCMDFYYLAKELYHIQLPHSANKNEWYFFLQRYVEMQLSQLLTNSIKIPSNERKEAYDLLKNDKEMQQALLVYRKTGHIIKLNLLNNYQWALPFCIHLEKSLILPVKRYLKRNASAFVTV